MPAPKRYSLLLDEHLISALFYGVGALCCFGACGGTRVPAASLASVPLLLVMLMGVGFSFMAVVSQLQWTCLVGEKVLTAFKETGRPTDAS